jgi:hypothetical protein
MKLSGYIKELVINSFVIPIYKSEKKYYFHKLDENFKILEFIETSIENPFFENLYYSKSFEIGSVGAVVFIGKEGYTNYGDAISSYSEIINYLADSTDSGTYKYIKEEVLHLKKICNGGISENIQKVKRDYKPYNKRSHRLVLKSNAKKYKIVNDYNNVFEEYSNYYSQFICINPVNLKTNDVLERPFISQILNNSIVNEINDDPISKVVIIHLFEDFLNTNLGTSKTKVFNKPFINKFSRFLNNLKSPSPFEESRWALAEKEGQKLNFYNNTMLHNACYFAHKEVMYPSMRNFLIHENNDSEKTTEMQEERADNKIKL